MLKGGAVNKDVTKEDQDEFPKIGSNTWFI